MSLISRARLIVLLALPLLILVANPHIAKADSITISPPRFEVFGNPGDTISDKIKVDNDNNFDLTLQTTVEDFTANGDQGNINLIEDPDAPTTNISLARWVTVEPSRFTIPANSEKVIDYTIKIPKGAEPGGKYASVLISRAGDKVDGGASVTSQLGSLILLRVSGAVTEKLAVDTFDSDDNYYQHGPVTFSLRTKNSGNVHVAPTGTIVITNLFGKKVAEVPITEANVLPSSARAVKTTWNNVPKFGRFTATLVATYGQTNQKITASTSFTVIPVSLIIAIVVVLLLIIFLITGRRKIKRMINKLTSD